MWIYGSIHIWKLSFVDGHLQTLALVYACFPICEYRETIFYKCVFTEDNYFYKFAFIEASFHICVRLYMCIYGIQWLPRMHIYGSTHIPKPTSINAHIWKLYFVNSHLWKLDFVYVCFRICACTKSNFHKCTLWKWKIFIYAHIQKFPSINENEHLWIRLPKIFIYGRRLSYMYVCGSWLPYMRIDGSWILWMHIWIYMEVGFHISTYTKVHHFNKCTFMEFGFFICVYTEANFHKCAFTKANFHICALMEVGFCIYALPYIHIFLCVHLP
jgi:hypothetical protein